MAERLRELPESSLTVRAGIIISLICAFVVSGVTIVFQHEKRLAVIETQQIGLSATLTEIKAQLCDIQKDLKEQRESQIARGYR